MKFRMFLMVSLVCILPLTVNADSIGNGYNCTGSALKAKGKSISLANSKKALSALIKTTKSQVKQAPAGSSKKTRLQAKVTSLKETLTLVKSCGAGDFVPTIFTTISGSYPNGVWNNTTFDSTGGISGNISLSETILSISINIGGSMFGSLTPGPVEIQKDVGGATFPFHFTAAGTTIGDLDVTISKTGGLTISETLVPVSGILRATLNATFVNDGYTGNFESFLIGDTKLAEGTMSLTR